MALKQRIAKSYRPRAGYWFVPKRFGWGMTPVTWQGWLATLVYAAILVASLRLLAGLPAKLAVAVPLTVGFIVLARRKTDGDVKWHWSLKR